MKTWSLLVTAGLFSVGWLTGLSVLALAGAGLYVLTIGIELILVYRESKQYLSAEGQSEKPGAKQIWAQRLEVWLDGLIPIAGMVAVLVDRPGFSLPGAVVFLAAMVGYFAGGVIVQVVAGIPLRMGYGGWYVARRRRPRRRY